MNAPPADEPLAQSTPKAASPSFSLLIRRVHMFTGLFLAPWMLMYALSTLVMTHRDYVLSFYSSKRPEMVTERELDYARSFPTGATREDIGRQILKDIGLEGSYSVSGGRNGKPLVVNRQHALTTRRVTFDAVSHKLTIQREQFRTSTFLERMHRRRGYNAYALENSWGSSVDFAVVTMIFWSLSGLWLWWELKATRLWGALSFASGMALFTVFALTI